MRSTSSRGAEEAGAEAEAMAEAEVEGAAAGGGRGVAEDDGASSSSAAAAVTSPLRASFLSAFVSDDSAISAANSAALNRSERGETRGLCEKRGGKRERREKREMQPRPRCQV